VALEEWNGANMLLDQVLRVSATHQREEQDRVDVRHQVGCRGGKLDDGNLQVGGAQRLRNGSRPRRRAEARPQENGACALTGRAACERGRLSRGDAVRIDEYGQSPFGAKARQHRHRGTAAAAAAIRRMASAPRASSRSGSSAADSKT